jgi:DUF4097 and DUF4098 domain-containing protein YvlB
MRRMRIIVLSGAICSLLSSGCYEAERHGESLVIDEAVASIRVDVGSGDVKLVGADVSEVTVSARIEGPSNHLAHSLADGRLTLTDDCHESHCSVDVTATVPAGVLGDLNTGSGDLTVVDLLAPLVLSTGSGDILGWDLAGFDLSAETGSGDVSLDVAGAAERITVQTGSGDVTLDVPAGGYRLSVITGSGDSAFHAVADDSEALGAIDVVTGSGDVTIRGH